MSSFNFDFPQTPGLPSAPQVFGPQFNPGDFQFTGANESLQKFQTLNPEGFSFDQLQGQLFGNLLTPQPPVQFGQAGGGVTPVRPQAGRTTEADLGYHWDAVNGRWITASGSGILSGGGTQFSLSPEQMAKKLAAADQQQGIIGDGGQELVNALLLDMQQTRQSEEFRVNTANMLAAMGLQLGQEGSQSILDQAQLSSGRLQAEAERLSALGQSGVDQTVAFSEKRFAEVKQFINAAVETAQRTLENFLQGTQDFDDVTTQRTSAINIAMHRRSSMRMAELEAMVNVGQGADAQRAQEQMQQLAMDTQFAADKTVADLEFNRTAILQRANEVAGQLGTSIAGTQLAGANTLGQLSAAQGTNLQQALGNQLGFEQLGQANIQMMENLMAAAQTNALQFNLLGMQFARDTFQAPHYPSFLEPLLALKAIPENFAGLFPPGASTGLLDAFT